MVKPSYLIEVIKKVGAEELVIAQIHAQWCPTDSERFAWDLGGDYLRITEEPQIAAEPRWPPIH